MHRLQSSENARAPEAQTEVATPGKRSLAEPVQRRAVQRMDSGEGAADPGRVHAAAQAGVQGAGGPLPYREQIQAAFGPHDVSGTDAFVGGPAAEAADAIGAEAYATGNSVAFRSAPDLHTAAHEAAHVVQQRGGVSLKGGVGESGDAHEQHADAVADRVVRGESAVDLLEGHGGAGATTAVQRLPPPTGRSDAIRPPQAAINKMGFIDNDEGSNIRTGPAESGGQALTATPMPPATRVFVSGKHPDAPEWWYVTATLPDESMVRGYVQHFRVTTDLPEPTSHLYQIKSGDTPREIAAREFSHAVEDGHDLRYYENVLLYVNRKHQRGGISGEYQDPNVFGGGDNNIRLEAGRRIWLVSPAYAKAVEGVVPDGSLTNGAVAKVGRFAGHLSDILASVAQSPHHLGAVAGEYAQAIIDNLPAIVGIVAGFLAAEMASAFLAATPTGVGQIAAVVIQLGLASFGAMGLVDAGVQAMKHGVGWLQMAWTANGRAELIAEASKEFLRMLVNIAMAALAYLGVRGNMNKAVTIANNIPPMGGMMPAMATVGGGRMPGVMGGVMEGVAIGPPGRAGAIGTGAMAMEDHSPTSSGETRGPKLPTGLDAKLYKLLKDIIDRARGGKFKKAGNYHAHFDDATVQNILSDADAIYQSEGGAGRLVFRKGQDIVIVEGTGSGRGNVVTGYGPSGIKGDSGAAALGGAAGDAGQPITHAMIVNGTIPVPAGRPPIPKAVQIAP